MKKNLLVTIILLLTLLGSVMAQTRTITGTVTSAEDGEPLPGVNVVVVGSTIGTITGANGTYSINVPASAQSLEFLFIGMEAQTVAIGNQTIIDVAMAISAVDLEEVVVTALGIERKEKALGFAVQQLDSEQLTSSRELNIAGYLTAKVAGVQVSKTSSGTGGSSSVTIRGNASITGSNQPLYVVDGVPIINVGKTSGGMWGDNDYGDGIGDINPEDVESMSVLKGPNAAALYGSRGANGVIIITTKSGKKTKGVTVEVNSNLSIDKVNLIPTYQNKYATGYEGTNIYGSMVEIDGEFYETMDTWHGDSWGPPLDGRRTIVNPFEYPENKNTRTMVLLPQPNDNVREFYETGVSNSNTVAISGSTETTSSRLSFGNVSQTGIVPNHKVNKYNVALRTSSKVSKWLSFDSKFNYIHTDGSMRPNLGSSRDNVNRTFVTMGRYVPMDWLKEYYEETGTYGRWPGVTLNPYYVINELKNSDYRDRMLGYASATAQFTDWLSLMGRVGADFYTEYRKKIWPVGDRGYSKGRMTTEMLNRRDINADLLLTASKQLSDDFSGSLTLGSSLLTQRRDREYMDARELRAEGVYNVSNAADLRPSSSLWEKEMQSVYFMGQLGYKNYLFLDVTGRNDWSSALGQDNYSFFYPSAGLSFVFSDAFNMDSKILSFGKVRASWAQVGNDSDPYMTKAGYSSYTTNFLGQGFSSKSGTIPLFDLKNELSESWEIGADLRFLQNRLSLDVTYYNGHTTNQILPISISSTSGYSTVIINAGQVSNKGIEAVLNLTPVNMTNGFRWDISFNYAKNTSIVDELAPGIERYRIADNYPNDVYANPGEPYGTIVGYATKQSPDGRYVVNPNGAYARESNVSVLGNITPDWIGGLNNTFWFKGFSMNVLIDFVQGGELSSSSKYQMTAKGTGLFTEEGRRPQDTDDQGNQLPYVGVLDGVVEILDGEGNVTGYEENTKAVDGQTYWASRAWGGPTDWFVLDGSYISLREVMISYRFQPSLLEKTPIAGLTLSLVGRNLLYLEEHMQDMGISPESAPNTSAGYAGIESMAIPTTRTFGVNLKVTF
ncbi:MAG: SusC/RagA family TonB-linked outer membrane protein [Bacteroidota bacterium]